VWGRPILGGVETGAAGQFPTGESRWYFVAVAAFLVPARFGRAPGRTLGCLGVVGDLHSFWGPSLTCYYYSFIIVVALLLREKVSGWAQRLVAAHGRHPVRGLGTDQRYAHLARREIHLMSVATLIAFVAITWEFFSKRRLAAAGATAIALCLDGPEAESAEQEKPGQRSAQPQSPSSPAAVSYFK